MKTVMFEYVKSTKNTHKYEEVPLAGQPAIIGSLYVQKWAYPSAPKTLTLQLGATEAEQAGAIALHANTLKSNIMPA